MAQHSTWRRQARRLQEEIRDLLVLDAAPVQIREVMGGGVCLAGASEREVNSKADMAATLEQGSLLRATASTGMNKRSSRSHAIFTITVEQRRQVPNGSTANGEAGQVLVAHSQQLQQPAERKCCRAVSACAVHWCWVFHALWLSCWQPLLLSHQRALHPSRPRHAISFAGTAGRHADGYSSDEDDRQEGQEEDGTLDEYLCAKMHLVDLAGSERVKRTKAEGQRLKEGENV